LSAPVVSAQKTGPSYVRPQEMDDDSDLSSDLFASSTAGEWCRGIYCWDWT